MSRISENLKHWRETRELTLEKLSEKTASGRKRPIAVSTITRLEDAKSKKKPNPTLDVLERLAAALEIDVTVLVGPPGKSTEDGGAREAHGGGRQPSNLPPQIDWPKLLNAIAGLLSQTADGISQRAADQQAGRTGDETTDDTKAG